MIRAVLVRLVLCLSLLIVVVAGLGAFAFRDFRPRAMTIGQQVFFFGDPDRVDNWMGLNAHEDAHRAQYRDHGLLGFLRDYVFDPEQRLRWEIEAHHADLCYRTLTHPDPPEVKWEKEARRLARYVSLGPGLLLDSVRQQAQRELSPEFCGRLLAGIGVRELPRSEFPADAVLRGLLSPALVADLEQRVSLHVLAGPWSLPADSAIAPAAAQAAWEVVGWSPLAVPSSGLWPFAQTGAPAEPDAIRLQLDSLQVESLELLARSPTLPWFDVDLRSEPSYSDHLDGAVALWEARIQQALSSGDYGGAEQGSRALLSLGLRIHGTTLQNAGREYSARMVRDGIQSLRRARTVQGDTASARLLGAQPEGDLDIFRAASAREFLTALPDVLQREEVPLSVRWGLLATGYALARCGAPSTTGVGDAGAWLQVQAARIGLSERAVVERIQQWPRDGWHCGGGAVVAVVKGDSGAAGPLPVLPVADSRKMLAELAAAWCAHPACAVPVMGITGTLGKTSTLRHLETILGHAGRQVGTIGSIGIRSGGAALGSTGYTVPGPIRLHEGLRELVDRGCNLLAMEATTHAMTQDRLHGVEFAAGVSTGLVPLEHMDYHGSFRAYVAAKLRFFDYLQPNAPLVFHSDDLALRGLVGDRDVHPVPCGTGQEAAVRMSIREVTPRGTVLDLRVAPGVPRLDGSTAEPFETEVMIPLIGRSPAANAVLAAAAAVVLGAEQDAVRSGLEHLEPAPRRTQIVRTDPFILLDDYGGHPSILNAAFEAVQALPWGRLHVVTGYRGLRGEALNRAAAETLALWLRQTGCASLRLTRSAETADELTRATEPEVRAFQEGLRRAGIRFLEIEGLDEALRGALAEVEPGDLFLVLGSREMDGASARVQQWLDGGGEP